MVASQPVVASVVSECYRAVITFRDIAAVTTEREVGEPPPVQEKDGLVAGVHRRPQPRRQPDGDDVERCDGDDHDGQNDIIEQHQDGVEHGHRAVDHRRGQAPGNDLGHLVVDHHAGADLTGKALPEIGGGQPHDMVEEPTRRRQRQLGLQPEQVVLLEPDQNQLHGDRDTHGEEQRPEHPLLAGDEELINEDAILSDDMVEGIEGKISYVSSIGLANLVFLPIALYNTINDLWTAYVRGDKEFAFESLIKLFTIPLGLLNAIEKLILNERLRQELGENGRRRVREHYNWDNCLQQMINIYEDTLKESC